MAGAGFIRRFTFDPGMEELLAIEGVVIIDREPPAQLTGVGTGMVTLIAEFEDGPFETPYQVASSADFLATFGGFGFVYDGTPSNNPCARTRKADGAIAPEYWNGNGFISLTKKRFRQLNVVRVDTSVGAVEFRRLAWLLGASDFSFDLEPGQFITTDVGGGPLVATFNATAAVLTGVAFVGALADGDTITIGYDAETDFTVTFLATDVTIADAISRINQTAGFTFASNFGGAIRFTGRVRGTDGEVRIVSEAPAGVLAKLGLSLSVVNGTGNVGNIDAVSSAEVDAVINAANPAVNVTRDSATNKLLMANTATPLAGTLVVTATTATALGFTAGQSADAAVGVDGVIPAGTRVRNGVGTEWVTAQTTAVTADNPGPYSIKVRPSIDDTLTAGAGAGSVTVLPFPIQTVGAFAVINPSALAAALTESQLDAKYVAALDTTKNLSSIVRQTNVIASARQSNAIRTALRTNVIEASSEGCFGRMAVIRPPLKTTRAAAKSIAAQPGVGAYRHGRVVYCYPGAHIYVPQIAAVGTAGGPGFTADGQIDVGFDLWVASVLSQLPPEENPGQATDFMSEILSVETGNADVQNLAIGDYRAFKAAGIASLRMDQGVAIIQSGVTSVDPLVNPNLKNINRQRMADFITDTLSLRLNAFSKQLATRVRRALIVGEIDSFMSTLRGDANPANQRIEGYLLDAISGNTPETLAAGLFRIILRVRTLPSMDVIVLDTQVGETVNISQAA